MRVSTMDELDTLFDDNSNGTTYTITYTDCTASGYEYREEPRELTFRERREIERSSWQGRHYGPKRMMVPRRQRHDANAARPGHEIPRNCTLTNKPENNDEYAA